MIKPENGVLSLDLSAGYILLVDCFQDLSAANYGRLGESLALSQLQQSFTFFKLLLVLFECLVDVFTIF